MCACVCKITQVNKVFFPLFPRVVKCILNFFHAYGYFFGIYVCTPHVFLVPVEARKPTELELQTVVSYHVSAGN